MSDIKSPGSRIHVGTVAQAGNISGQPALERPKHQLPVRVERSVDLKTDREPNIEMLVAEFIAPPRETAEWLGNPSMPAALVAVSGELAPGGVAASKRDQYVASVVETHLSARRQLARHLNALLRA